VRAKRTGTTVTF